MPAVLAPARCNYCAAPADIEVVPYDGAAHTQKLCAHHVRFDYAEVVALRPGFSESDVPL